MVCYCSNVGGWEVMGSNTLLLKFVRNYYYIRANPIHFASELNALFCCSIYKTQSVRYKWNLFSINYRQNINSIRIHTCFPLSDYFFQNAIQHNATWWVCTFHFMTVTQLITSLKVCSRYIPHQHDINISIYLSNHPIWAILYSDECDDKWHSRKFSTSAGHLPSMPS